MLVVLSERILKSKTYKEVANMLNLKQAERIRQIEARVVRILYNKMKGYN
jgi:DNA-directed RNA polymerase sigma subunit (sigma70/sigma32)